MNNFKNFEHIAGYHKEKSELIGLRNLLTNVENFRKSGVRMPRGVLLYGAPGVGKTVMAKSIATDGIACVELRSADCTREDSEDYVLSAFEEAREKAPCVLLIDELDKIAESNEHYYMEGNDRIMKVLLQELDGQKDNSGVMVVATCNNCNHLNPALLRSGRFDRIIEIGTPTLEDRVEIIKYYLSKINLEKKLNEEYFAKITAGYSGAQLECIINEAGIMAMQDSISFIDMKTLQRAMNRIAFRALEGKTTNKDEQWKTAVHEAGHAVIAMFVAPDSITSASIIPHGKTRGHVRMMYDDEITESVEEVENSIIVGLGGAVAEEVILGMRYMSSTSDFGKARWRLLSLIMGIGAYGIEFAGLFSGHHCETPSSPELAAKSDKIYAEKIKEFYERGKQIIEDNRDFVDRVAHLLVEKSTLSKEELFELYEIIKGKQAA